MKSFPPPPRSSSEQLWFLSQREGQWGPAHPEVLGVQVLNGSSSRLLSPGPCNITKPLRSASGAPAGHISFAIAYAVLQTSLGFDCVVFAQSPGAVQARARQSRMRYIQRTRGRTRVSSELGSAPGSLPLSRAGALWQAVVSKPHLPQSPLVHPLSMASRCPQRLAANVA